MILALTLFIMSLMFLIFMPFINIDLAFRFSIMMRDFKAWLDKKLDEFEKDD